MAEQALQPYKNNPYLPNSSWAAPFPPPLKNKCLQPHEDDPHITPSYSSLLPSPLKKCLITHTLPPAVPPLPPPHKRPVREKMQSGVEGTQCAALTLRPRLLTGLHAQRRPPRCAGTWRGGCRFYAVAWLCSSGSWFHPCPADITNKTQVFALQKYPKIITQNNNVV